MSACGSKAAVVADKQTNALQTNTQQTNTQNVQEQKASTPAPVEAATAEEVIPTADPSESIDSLLGTWTDVNSVDRFAEITKTDTGYLYKDNEGTYPATFKDGKLTLQLSDTETAEVSYDIKTGHMFSIYQDSPTEFKKN
jgi:hypothetical protein